MMRIYISGPMTGYINMNFPAFEKAAETLRAAGLEVVSPHEVETIINGTWDAYMRADLALLLTCDAVATLEGHQASIGATLECHVARALHMPVEPMDYWLKELAA